MRKNLPMLKQRPDLKALKAQRGVALLTVLLMVVLSSIIVAAILSRQNVVREQTAAMIYQDQALLYAKSAELFIIELLKQDAKDDNNVDSLNETWAKPWPEMPVDTGVVISGQVTDLSGLFNLNNLVDPETGVSIIDPDVKNPVHDFFSRLLSRTNLSPELVAAVIDWQDQDDETSSAMGAENSFYQGLQPAYLAANQAMVNSHELSLVRGFEQGRYAQIAPYLTAVPKMSSININTAPAMLLASLDESLSLEQVQSALDKQRTSLQVFESVDNLWQIAPFDQIDDSSKAELASLLAVHSEFFKLQIKVSIADRDYYVSTLLYRDDDQVTIYSRHFSAAS